MPESDWSRVLDQSFPLHEPCVKETPSAEEIDPNVIDSSG